jgi:hypothetical protein
MQGPFKSIVFEGNNGPTAGTEEMVVMVVGPSSAPFPTGPCFAKVNSLDEIQFGKRFESSVDARPAYLAALLGERGL